MILRSRKIDGAEALRIGLVSELAPLGELKARAQALGEALARQPRAAVKAMLNVILGHETKSLSESLAEERAAVMAISGNADAREGMLAFQEKRRPVFNRPA
jgi:enoyl-CoA hydratase